MTKFESFLRL